MFSAPHGDRPNARNILVILSAQSSLVNPAQPDLLTTLTSRAKDNGIAIFTVGIGNQFDSTQLQTISSSQFPSSVTFFQSSSFASLQGLVGATVTNICRAATG